MDEPPSEHKILSQLLPPSIVSLEVAENMEIRMVERLAKSLLHLAEAASKGQFPRLKTVRCDTGLRLDDHGVGDMFIKAGVDFGYDTWPLSGGTARPDPRASLRPTAVIVASSSDEGGDIASYW
jgi:hypothetical protein